MFDQFETILSGPNEQLYFCHNKKKHIVFFQENKDYGDLQKDIQRELQWDIKKRKK